MNRLLPFALACVFRLDGEPPVWQPDKTWVFAVGVMRFDNPAAVSWPDEGRVDVEMIHAHEKRGVPSDCTLIANLSGRGDKDQEQASKYLLPPLRLRGD